MASSRPSDWFPSDADAIRAAREEVKAMFRTADQLPRIGAYLGECMRKKAGVEAQLSSAVRTQVDETRLGLQLLKEAQTMMTQMRRNFLAIDQYCKESKLVLRDSPEIQRVNTARKNLDATTRLLDKFRSLPVQAEAIIDQLNENDREIKDVYKSLRKLFHLRDSAMDQPSSGITMPGVASGFSADFLAQLQENFAELSKSAEVIEERIWENMADASFLAKDDPITLVRTLEVIEMEDRAMRKVFGHTKREIADAQNALKGKKAKEKDYAVATFLGASQVVSMREKCHNVLEKSIADLFQHLHIDEEQNREQQRKEAADKKKAAAAKAEKNRLLGRGTVSPRAGGDGDDDDVDEPEDEMNSPSGPGLGPMARGGLFHSAEEVDEEEEEAARAEATRDGRPSDYVLTILEEMTDLVENLPATLSTMLPCFPPDYNLAPFFVERYLRWMKLTLSFHTNDPAKLSRQAQLRTVNWIEWYRAELRKWDVKFPGCRVPIPPPSSLSPTSMLTAERLARDATRKEVAEVQYFDDLIRDLMKSYTASTESTLLKLCDNILASEKTAEAERDALGRFVTSGPPDLFYTINSTIEIVLANFGHNAKPLSFVCLMLAKVFEHYQNRQLEFLSDVIRGEKDQDDQLFFGEEQIHKSDTYFAAIINNSAVCQEHMDDLSEKIIERLREAEGIEQAAPVQYQPTPGGSSQPPKTLLEQMEDLFEECGEGFVAVASEGIDLLVLQISITLQKPMSNLFSPSWLKDSGVTNDLVLTLQDFMEDYKKWVGRDAYFSRVLVKTLHSVVAEYLRILTLTKPQVSAQLFGRIKEDKKILQEFFVQYTSADSGALLPPQLLKNELRLLTLVNKVAHEDVDFMAVHFDVMITRFGHSAGEVMEGLMAMRTDLTRSQRAEVMAKFNEKLPRARPEELLEKQLVAQNVAAMASPKQKGKRGGGGDNEETSFAASLWERFKNRDKGQPKKKQLVSQSSSQDGMTLQDFTS